MFSESWFSRLAMTAFYAVLLGPCACVGAQDWITDSRTHCKIADNHCTLQVWSNMVSKYPVSTTLHKQGL